MGYRLAKILGVLCLVAGTVLAVPAPAGASTSGEIVFACEARYSSWPSPGGTASCGRGLVGHAQVSVSGTATDGNAYLVDGLGEPTLSLSHGAACVAGEPSLLGTMYGTLYISEVPALHNGNLTVASIALRFSATVAGTDMTFTTSDHRITFASGVAAIGSTGVGNGAYFPLIGPANTCPQGGPMTALMQGEIDLLI